MKRILCLGILLCLLTACAGPVEMTSQESDTAASYGTENETDVPIESEEELFPMCYLKTKTASSEARMGRLFMAYSGLIGPCSFS